MGQQINQKTLVFIKPDAMARNLAGEIIARFQRVGLKIINCKMMWADKKLAEAHYPVTDEWLVGVGNHTLDDCKRYGYEAKEVVGTDDPKEIGHLIHRYNQEMLLSGPVLAMVLEGSHAVEVVRKLVGHTIPILAAPGTIRGDYSNDSSIVANPQKRTIYTLVHASGTPEEAEREITLWFGK
ncbi:nucleoside-diphosphate kinase [Candidatus Daviesbacteria bacterium RIFCSPHIGHO2_01_FULL_43_17]|nr:MAG: nucleoside-diphosphate kinase [Candidatus Daviesbacteria bacterium RIFCSPHIGHO2_01_FULL_43_17]